MLPKVQRLGEQRKGHCDQSSYSVFNIQVFPAEKMVSVNNWYHKVSQPKLALIPHAAREQEAITD